MNEPRPSLPVVLRVGAAKRGPGRPLPPAIRAALVEALADALVLDFQEPAATGQSPPGTHRGRYKALKP